MAIGDYDLIQQAGRVLRAAPEPGWAAVEARVIAAVRATPRGGWPLAVVDPDPDGSRGVIRVSDLVVTTLLSHALRDDPDYIATDIRATSDDGVLQRVSVDVSCRYLADVNAVSERVHSLCRAVLDEVIGSDVEVAVAVTDVHR
ncbi:Uncharacterised protein [Mycolicibacterium aurum]|uniref:Asp23/Gls24 family envelope stress response protein n=1 Tax=Mycolicibacterium aurum TaxID=1791 RepID=A0A3S4T4V1_MYCAU|nr:hypothetical protein [Mycolicibacterium aurum]VEG50934.1 Uncharacterised protein [Mycolicibacterium aurum]